MIIQLMIDYKIFLVLFFLSLAPAPSRLDEFRRQTAPKSIIVVRQRGIDGDEG
jgi:hypothetical protein